MQSCDEGHATILTCITPPYISFTMGLLIKMLLLPCFTVFRILACKYVYASPTPLCCSLSYEMYMGNNEEMAFNYTEVIVYHSFTRPRGVLQRFRW